jgi:KTSC domain-containing protein
MSLPSERVPLDSSTLVAATYDHHRGQLQLDFHNGARYIYSSVSAAIFAELIQAHSKGKFFNRYIRGHFPYAKNPS